MEAECTMATILYTKYHRGNKSVHFSISWLHLWLHLQIVYTIHRWMKLVYTNARRPYVRASIAFRRSHAHT